MTLEDLFPAAERAELERRCHDFDPAEVVGGLCWLGYNWEGKADGFGPGDVLRAYLSGRRDERLGRAWDEANLREI